MARSKDTVPTLDKAAEYLRIPRSAPHKLAQEGKIPGQKVGRHWWFRGEAIGQWLRSKEARH